MPERGEAERIRPVRSLPLVCVVAWVLACGARTTAGDGSSGDGTAGTADDGSGGVSDGGSTVTGDGGDSGSTGGGDDCPAGQMVQGRFETSFVETDDFDGECTVDAVTTEAIATTLELSCAGEPATVTITADPTVSLAHLEGRMVAVTYATELPFWLERWLVVREPEPMGMTWIAAIEAPELDPFGTTVERPGLDLAIVDGVCEPSPGDCSTVERLAVDVTAMGETRRVVDGNADRVGDYEVRVEWARANHPPIMCTDLPGRWIGFVAMRVDSG